MCFTTRIRSLLEVGRVGVPGVLVVMFRVMKGTIARVTDRGFGFIKPDEGGDDVFFHARSLEGIMFDELREGDAVTYEVEDGPKGPAAIKVMRADDAAGEPEAPAAE